MIFVVFIFNIGITDQQMLLNLKELSLKKYRDLQL